MWRSYRSVVSQDKPKCPISKWLDYFYEVVLPWRSYEKRCCNCLHELRPKIWSSFLSTHGRFLRNQVAEISLSLCRMFGWNSLKSSFLWQRRAATIRRSLVISNICGHLGTSVDRVVRTGRNFFCRYYPDLFISPSIQLGRFQKNIGKRKSSTLERILFMLA